MYLSTPSLKIIQIVDEFRGKYGEEPGRMGELYFREWYNCRKRSGKYTIHVLHFINVVRKANYMNWSSQHTSKLPLSPNLKETCAFFRSPKLKNRIFRYFIHEIFSQYSVFRKRHGEPHELVTPSIYRYNRTNEIILDKSKFICPICGRDNWNTQLSALVL